MSLERLPTSVSRLIARLDKAYPARPLGPAQFSTPERQLWFEAGRRALVDELLALQKADVPEDEDEDSKE